LEDTQSPPSEEQGDPESEDSAPDGDAPEHQLDDTEDQEDGEVVVDDPPESEDGETLGDQDAEGDGIGQAPDPASYCTGRVETLTFGVSHELFEEACPSQPDVFSLNLLPGDWVEVSGAHINAEVLVWTELDETWLPLDGTVYEYTATAQEIFTVTVDATDWYDLEYDLMISSGAEGDGIGVAPDAADCSGREAELPFGVKLDLVEEACPAEVDRFVVHLYPGDWIEFSAAHGSGDLLFEAPGGETWIPMDGMVFSYSAESVEEVAIIVDGSDWSDLAYQLTIETGSFAEADGIGQAPDPATYCSGQTVDIEFGLTTRRIEEACPVEKDLFSITLHAGEWVEIWGVHINAKVSVETRTGETEL
ncbi:MAG: hypothetical protein KC561_20685, partial [Myxococcales bacterium]|nr:hypothetical protein [Myxococcales bacterium]